MLSRRLPARPAVFERQRIEAADWLPVAELRPLAAGATARLAASVPADDRPWMLHAYGAVSEFDARAQGLGRAFLRELKRSDPARATRCKRDVRSVEPWVLQLCRVENGLWFGCARRDALSDPYPAGAHRMRQDPAAPSRSHLKLEEAIDRMGVAPREGETAVDLGAAPGGWSWSLLRRGCAVTAVDNGPMRVDHPRLVHLRADGLSWPPTPTDWLVSDMLVPPGKCLGVLRRWMAAGAMRRFVVNAKIPQRQPLPALGPLLEFLRQQSDFEWACRQLYHDRREVTAWGWRREPRPISFPSPTASDCVPP